MSVPGATPHGEGSGPVIIGPGGLQALIDALQAEGYRTIGPRLEAQAIVYDDISSVSDFPKGWTDSQDGGRYRLERTDDEKLFGYAVGPHSWKKFLHPPLQTLWRAKRDGQNVTVEAGADPDRPFAFFGVRACELNAIAIQDTVFLEGPHVDPHYAARRKGAFLVAVNCSKAGGTCFCASMNTGPRAESGYDLVLTEIGDGAMVCEAGSETGRTMLDRLPSRAATGEEMGHADAVVSETANSMGRQMRSDDLHDLLLKNLDHPRWDEVADRCLSCANCTMVCPTCFCTSVEDHNDLNGLDTARTQRWDSCFTTDFTYIHGGSVRQSTRSRYRQWMTHKLATWIDQFGTSGCVGCGRCITWCPVGIDITEEVAAIRADNTGTGGA